MPHWARKGSLRSQAPGKGGCVAKKAGARGGSPVTPGLQRYRNGGRRLAGAGKVPAESCATSILVGGKHSLPLFLFPLQP